MRQVGENTHTDQRLRRKMMKNGLNYSTNIVQSYWVYPRITENEEKSRIVHCELDINKGPFTSDEIDKAVRSITNCKAVGIDTISAEVWKLEVFKDILLHFSKSVYNQDPIQRWNEGCLLPFPKKET